MTVWLLEPDRLVWVFLKTADLLEISPAIISRVCKVWSEKEKTSSEFLFSERKSCWCQRSEENDWAEKGNSNSCKKSRQKNISEQTPPTLKKMNYNCICPFKMPKEYLNSTNLSTPVYTGIPKSSMIFILKMVNKHQFWVAFIRTYWQNMKDKRDSWFSPGA